MKATLQIKTTNDDPVVLNLDVTSVSYKDGVITFNTGTGRKVRARPEQLIKFSVK